MRVAFYAPLKPPGHPVPSGDRRVARLLMAALERAGHRAILASSLRTFDGIGDSEIQKRIRREAEAQAKELIERYLGRAGDRPEAWLTYHPYYKAPDWIGPAVTGALGMRQRRRQSCRRTGCSASTRRTSHASSRSSSR